METTDTQQAAARRAHALRPLALKNTNAKAVASAVARTMQKAVATEAHRAQRGFVACRDHTANITEMDAFARMFALSAEAGMSPTLLLLDLEAAFPSISRSFLLAALRAQRFPAGLVAVVKGVFSENGLFSHGPPVRTLYVATSGVAQGFPLSGSLFVVVMDPALRRLQAAPRQRRAGMARACADDLAVALRSAWLVVNMARVLEEVEAVAGDAALVVAHEDPQEQTWPMRVGMAGLGHGPVGDVLGRAVGTSSAAEVVEAWPGPLAKGTLAVARRHVYQGRLTPGLTVSRPCRHRHQRHRRQRPPATGRPLVASTMASTSPDPPERARPAPGPVGRELAPRVRDGHAASSGDPRHGM